MVRKDLRLFFTDRRAVLLTFAAPIAIASFIGSITQNAGRSAERTRISVAIVDEDGSTISKAIVAGVQKDENLTAVPTTAEEARERVRRGTTSVALIIPDGFGKSAGRSLFRPAGIEAKPQLDVLFDPSRTAEVGMVRGIFTEHAMQAVGQEMFSGATGRQNIQQTLNDLDSSSIPADTRARLRTMLASVLA